MATKRNINEYLASGEVEKIKVGKNGSIMVALEEVITIPKDPEQSDISNAIQDSGQDMPNGVDIQCMATDGGGLYQLFYSYILDKWFYSPLGSIKQAGAFRQIRDGEVIYTDDSIGRSLSRPEIESVLNDNNISFGDINVNFYIVEKNKYCWLVKYLAAIDKFAIEKLTLK